MKNNNLQYTDFIYCYDLTLFNMFKGAGIPYILKARSIQNNTIFTMYEKTPEVIAVYEEWETIKFNSTI